MSPRQADRLIKSGKPVTFHNTHFNETFRGTAVGRDRWNLHIRLANDPNRIAILDRGELIVVQPEPDSAK